VPKKSPSKGVQLVGGSAIQLPLINFLLLEALNADLDLLVILTI